MSLHVLVHVLDPGLLTTVQDRGREGWRHLGVARAGALDPDAATLANQLVGNPGDAAVLELTLLGPTLRWDRPLRIALCGAPWPMQFEAASGAGCDLPSGRPLELPAGTLRLGAVRAGARAWLAIAGGLDVPVVLGRRRTDLHGGFGGLDGRALRRGDVLALLAPPALACTAPCIPRWWVDPLPGMPRMAPLRYVPAPHPAASGLAERTWRVQASSDRQGLRLAGEALPGASGAALSEPVAPGTIQLPPDGQPIVLLADAQTVGGYPRLGHIIAADLPRLAQLRPGDVLRLAPCDATTARTLACAARERMARIELGIRLAVASRSVPA